MAIEQKEPKVQTQAAATQRRYRTLAVVKQEAITRVEKPLEDSVFVWPHLLVREFFAATAVTVMITCSLLQSMLLCRTQQRQVSRQIRPRLPGTSWVCRNCSTTLSQR